MNNFSIVRRSCDIRPRVEAHEQEKTKCQIDICSHVLYCDFEVILVV